MNGEQSSGSKKSCLILFLVAAVLLGGGGAGLWFFGVPTAKEYIIKSAVSETEKSFGVSAKIGDIGISSPTTVYINNVAFVSGDDGSPVLSAKRIEAAVSIMHLLRGKVIVKRVTCESPFLNFVRRADGSTNLDALLGRKKGRTANPITLEMNGIKLTYADYYRKPGAKPVTIYSEKAVFRVKPGKPVGIDIDGARYGKSVFEANGSVGMNEGDPVKLRVSSDNFRASELKNLLVSISWMKVPEISRFEVPLKIRIDVRGARGTEAVTISASADGGFVGSRKVERVRMKCAASREAIYLDRLDIRLRDGGSLSAKFRYRFSGGDNMDMELRSKNFPVDALTGVVKNWNPGVTGSLSMKGRLRGDPAKRETLEGECSFNASAGRVAGIMDGQPLEFDSIVGRFAVGGGRLQLNEFAMKGRDMDMTLEGGVGLDGTLDLSGRAEVEKGKVRTTGMRKLVSGLLPDGEKGYIFRIRIAGTFGAPKIEFNAADTLRRGVEDKVRDAGNKVEHFVKKIF